jgi:hypothetical protein
MSEGRKRTSRRALALAGLLTALASEARAQDPYEPHPDPRVIIDAVSSKPDKRTDAVQAAARRGFWGKVVGCYKRGASKEPKLEVDASLRIEIRGGVVKRAQLLKQKRAGARDSRAKAADEVGACLAKAAVGLSMPDGVGTAASLRIRVSPGDPVPRARREPDR